MDEFYFNHISRAHFPLQRRTALDEYQLKASKRGADPWMWPKADWILIKPLI
jgi:hypothetical protein